MKLVEVLPLSLGIKSNEDIYEVVIPRSSPIPIKMTKDFYTGVNDQTSMRFEVKIKFTNQTIFASKIIYRHKKIFSNNFDSWGRTINRIEEQFSRFAACWWAEKGENWHHFCPFNAGDWPMRNFASNSWTSGGSFFVLIFSEQIEKHI